MRLSRAAQAARMEGVASVEASSIIRKLKPAKVWFRMLSTASAR
jgi:hypothetical protein